MFAGPHGTEYTFGAVFVLLAPNPFGNRISEIYAFAELEAIGGIASKFDCFQFMFLKAWPLPICSDLGKTSTSIKQLRVLFQGFPAGGVLLIEAREKSLCKLLPNLLCMVGFEIPWISLQCCF